MIFWIITFLVLLFVLFLVVTWEDYVKKETTYARYTLISFFVSGVLGVLIHSYITNSEPKAIDVYRGKTTLKITCVDSLPVDSVVVFKEEYKD